MFNPPVHHWRQTIFSIPETVSPKTYSRVYKTPQFESKTEGREPPDEDEPDFTPSPTPPFPRKSRSSFPTWSIRNPMGKPNPPGDDDPLDDGSSDGEPEPHKRGRPTPDWRDSSKNVISPKQNKQEAYFDNKLRPDIVPEWDRNPDTLAQWILKVITLPIARLRFFSN